MIWLIFGAFLLLLIIFVFAPLLRAAAPIAPDDGEALAEARGQLAGLESDLAAGRISSETASETRRALEFRVLDLLNAQSTDVQIGASEKTVGMLRLILPIGLCFGAFGLYTMLGQPNFKQTVASVEQAISLEDLVVTLQQKLGDDPTPPAEGYLLLARSLMTLDRYDEAFEAYETTLRLSDGDALVQDEYQRAKAYAEAVAAGQGQRRSGAGMPVLDDETMANAQAMTPEARAQMIEGMVAGLAARLEADPSDAEDWAKLIRARVVLGQDAQARADLQRASEVFENSPEQLALVTDAAREMGLDATD